jgi:PAS domain S-box-containing protein
MKIHQPQGGGATGDLLRAFDWSATSLGPMTAWSPALRTTVEIVLNSPIAMVLMWGPDHTMVYNDAYALIAGARHPAALGGTVPGVWPELWDWNRTVLEAGFRGEVHSYEGNCMQVLRNGVPEEVWFDLFYTPVRDDGGAVAGVLCTVQETTRKMQLDRDLKRATEQLDVANRTLLGESEAVREANRRLSEERSLLRALLDQSPSFMCLLRGPEHTFELTNEPCHRLLGNRDVIGQCVADVLPEALRQGFVETLDAVYRSGEKFSIKQMQWRVKTGLDEAPQLPQLHYVDLVCQPVRDHEGVVTGVFIEGTDVTERIETEERMRLSQEAGGIGSFEWFPDTGKMVVSPTYRRLWGLSDDEEITSDLLVSMVDARDRAKVGTNLIDSVANPLEYAEYRVRRTDTGEVRWLARQGEVINMPGGRRRYVGVTFDVTGRKLTEQALQASQDRLAAIFGQASVGLTELTLDCRFERVNGALCAMLGRSEQELLGMKMDNIIHPEDLPGNRALFERLVSTGEPFTLEKRYLKPDGSIVWVSSNVSRLVDQAGKPQALVAVKTDISERRRVEEALRDLNETLEQRVMEEVAERAKAEAALLQSQKMEAVGQLTGGIAHDFNNVLQIISGNLHLLNQMSMEDGPTRKRLDTALAAVERGARLSSHLLAFARRQPLQPVVSDLGRLVRSMDELLRRALGETIDVSTSVGSGLWNTMIDPSQLENVILNLAINARDAMGGAGKLTIELGNAVLDSQYVQNLVDVPAGQYVMLSVTDTGCGMTEDILQRAFEPFFTTKGEGEGTGLGLSMAYGFVKQSRGHIRIYSEPGHGTSIKIYLPRTLGAEAEEAVAPSGPVQGGTETILVVEDDAGVRATVVDMLTALGYTVLKAEDGQSALEVIETGAAIDLLFTDVVMPGPVRSTDMARRAQELVPDIAVLFTSGYPQNAIVHGGRLDAGVELLSKPYRREELARKLRHVLANRLQRMQARQFLPSAANGHRSGGLNGTPLNLTGDAVAANGTDAATSLRILVVEDNLDSQQMVCELVGMLGHTVHGVSDGESAWDLLGKQEFDILFTDVSLPGMSGITLAKKVILDKPMTRIVFSTGYGKEALDELGFNARILRKPYDLMELKAALDS